MQTCAICRHWYRLAPHDRLLEAFEPKDRPERGHCTLPNEDMFGFDMNEGLYVGIWSRSDFGCLGHEPKSETSQEDGGA